MSTLFRHLHSNNNEQLIINFTTVTGSRISIIPPAQSRGRKQTKPHPCRIFLNPFYWQ